MLVTVISVLTAVAALPSPTVSDICSSFFVGKWSGKGLVRGFGAPIKVDNSASYQANGTFATVNRYFGDDGKWSTQVVAGAWTATKGAKRNRCTLVMKTQSNGFEASSISEVQIINANTYRLLGFKMNRVRK